MLVEMKAAGVCHSDLHPTRGDWPMRTAAGARPRRARASCARLAPVVTRSRPGDHVVLCWAPACGVCPPCPAGSAVLCDRLEKMTFRNRLPSGGTRLARARDQDIAPFLGTACFASHSSCARRRRDRRASRRAVRRAGDRRLRGGHRRRRRAQRGSVPAGARRRRHRRRRRRPERRAGRRARRLRRAIIAIDLRQKPRSACARRSARRTPFGRPANDDADARSAS